MSGVNQGRAIPINEWVNKKLVSITDWANQRSEAEQNVMPVAEWVNKRQNIVPINEWYEKYDRETRTRQGLRQSNVRNNSSNFGPNIGKGAAALAGTAALAATAGLAYKYRKPKKKQLDKSQESTKNNVAQLGENVKSSKPVPVNVAFVTEDKYSVYKYVYNYFVEYIKQNNISINPEWVQTRMGNPGEEFTVPLNNYGAVFYVTFRKSEETLSSLRQIREKLSVNVPIWLIYISTTDYDDVHPLSPVKKYIDENGGFWFKVTEENGEYRVPITDANRRFLDGLTEVLSQIQTDDNSKSSSNIKSAPPLQNSCRVALLFSYKYLQRYPGIDTSLKEFIESDKNEFSKKLYPNISFEILDPLPPNFHNFLPLHAKNYAAVYFITNSMPNNLPQGGLGGDYWDDADNNLTNKLKNEYPNANIISIRLTAKEGISADVQLRTDRTLGTLVNRDKNHVINDTIIMFDAYKDGSLDKYVFPFPSKPEEEDTGSHGRNIHQIIILREQIRQLCRGNL